MFVADRYIQCVQNVDAGFRAIFRRACYVCVSCRKQVEGWKQLPPTSSSHERSVNISEQHHIEIVLLSPIESTSAESPAHRKLLTRPITYQRPRGDSACFTIFDFLQEVQPFTVFELCVSDCAPLSLGVFMLPSWQ